MWFLENNNMMCHFDLLVGSISVDTWWNRKEYYSSHLYVNNWASDNLSLDVVFVFLLEK